MQTVSELQAVTECNKHLSGYDLTTLLIRGGISKLGLNANAKLVLIYLASCYNEKNGCVYPRVKTMSESLEISERGVIRALAELTEMGCIIRTKKGKNTNIYVITNKVLNLSNNDITTGHHDISSSDTMTLPCHEVKQHEVKEQQPINKNVVAFSKKHKVITLADVPEIIRNNKKIDNPCGYWASLTDDVKNDYLIRQKEQEEKKKRKAERLKAEQKEKERIRAELKANENIPPFWETCTRDEGLKHLRIFKDKNMMIRTTAWKVLKQRFDLKLEDI